MDEFTLNEKYMRYPDFAESMHISLTTARHLAAEAKAIRRFGRTVLIDVPKVVAYLDRKNQ